MATVEAMTQLLTQNAEFFRTMQQQQHQQVQEILNLLQTMKAESGGGSDRRGEGLQERRFRELGNLSGSEEEWKEFGLKFCAVVKEKRKSVARSNNWENLSRQMENLNVQISRYVDTEMPSWKGKENGLGGDHKTTKKRRRSTISFLQTGDQESVKSLATIQENIESAAEEIAHNHPKKDRNSHKRRLPPKVNMARRSGCQEFEVN